MFQYILRRLGYMMVTMVIVAILGYIIIELPPGSYVDAEVARLRAQGHTVVCVLPGHESEVDEFRCDRALVLQAGAWILTKL